MTERRRAHRYVLTLPVTVGHPVEQPVESFKGKTRDISSRGVYFVIPENRFTVGSELHLTITLPSEVTGGANVVVRAAGTVVRVDRPESAEPDAGVAAMIDRCEIVREK